MSKKKIVALALAVAMLAVVIVGASLAYFSDKTVVAKNTFTVGKVDIKLEEHVVDKNGKATQELTQTGNNDILTYTTTDDQGNTVTKKYGYSLLPGQTVDKDPFVTVIGGSEECYVRIKVTLDNANEFLELYRDAIANNQITNLQAALNFFSYDGQAGYNSTDWIAQNLDSTAPIVDNKITVTFNYKEKVAKSATDTVLNPIVSAVTLPTFVTNAQAATFAENGFAVDVVAEAIQATGFADAAAAWAAFDDATVPFGVGAPADEPNP